MPDEKMIYGGINKGMQNVTIYFSIPDEAQVEEGKLPIFGVTVDDNACPHFADALAVFETEVTDKESADITAEWLESLAKKLRDKWAHNVEVQGREAALAPRSVPLERPVVGESQSPRHGEKG